MKANRIPKIGKLLLIPITMSLQGTIQLHTFKVTPKLFFFLFLKSLCSLADANIDVSDCPTQKQGKIKNPDNQIINRINN